MRKTFKSSNAEALIPKHNLSKEIAAILEERELTETEAEFIVVTPRRRFPCAHVTKTPNANPFGVAIS